MIGPAGLPPSADQASRRCPVCGLELPVRARFCARCGSNLRSRSGVASWLIMALWAGCGLEAGLGAIYGYIYFSPQLLVAHATATVTAADLRTASAVISISALIAFFLQASGCVLLVRGSLWGRITLSLVCVLWSVTLVGLPVSLFVLVNLWRRAPARALATLAR